MLSSKSSAADLQEELQRMRMPSGCPNGFSLTASLQQHLLEDPEQQGVNKVADGGITYTDYLRLDKLLDAQYLQSERAGASVADEHLFIITHQAYELWFKQIIYDLDRVRAWFNTPIVDETKMLHIVQMLERIVRILKLLADQMLILETMSPLDFIEFRSHLAPASGFQSLQFRLLENKLGVASANRVLYNAQHYRKVFRDAEDIERLAESEQQASLLQLVEKWLERTPGVSLQDGSAFWTRYSRAVNRYLNDLREEAKIATAGNDKKAALASAELDKMTATFDSVLDPRKHDELLAKGERRISHKALQGALLVCFYRDHPRFSQPYLILTLLMDIDSLITKWRYNHVMLVQRQLGSKQGTGGSSGYMYLRSTIADRYKVFIDLFNLSTFLLPRAYIPPLTRRLHETLTTHDVSSPVDGSTSPIFLDDDEEAAGSQQVFFNQ